MLEVIILKEFNEFCDTTQARVQKKKKKKAFRFCPPPPPLRIPGDAPATYLCYINAACTCRSTLGNQLNMC